MGAVFGALAEYFVSRGLDRIVSFFQRMKIRRAWAKSQEALKRFQYIAHGFEIVQHGWEAGVFQEDQIVLTDEKEFRLVDEIAENIREPQRAKWIEEGKRDNQQYGIYEIQQIRETERAEEGRSTHRLVLRGHRYRYFDSMSTHFTYLNKTYGFDTLEEVLANYLIDNGETKPNRQAPIRIFPSPISVGISLFCENGDCLVMTHRTSSTSGGGHLFAGKVFNAVGENVNHEQDGELVEYVGKTTVSPWRTAIRGLWQEIGITHTSRFESEIKLHSFVWDRRILDYKFFGYAVYDIHRSVVERSFRKAPDYSESKEIIFLEVANEGQCKSVLQRIIRERDTWSSEAIYCTLSSLLNMGKLNASHLDEFLLKSELTGA